MCDLIGRIKSALGFSREDQLKKDNAGKKMQATSPSVQNPRKPKLPSVAARLQRLVFSDGSTLELSDNDIVVFVGPNNAGKSSALSDIIELVGNRRPGKVIRDLSIKKTGTKDDVEAWLASISNHSHLEDPAKTLYKLLKCSIWSHGIELSWECADEKGLSHLTPLFFRYLKTEDRLQEILPEKRVNYLREPLSHPLHFLDANEEIERTISSYIQKVFGESICVHRGSGSEIELIYGTIPEIPPNLDRISIEYLSKLDRLERAHIQGDGVRSCLGILLNTLVAPTSCVLIDEPEAFLHPPQSKLIGQLLANELPQGTQLLLATHSGDLLRGLLDAGSNRVRIVRIERAGDQNKIQELPEKNLLDIINDPFFRHSNVLDGLFHKKILVCESEGDCRFFCSIVESLEESRMEYSAHDILMVGAGGKDGISKISSALRSIGLPVIVVADFDVLRTKETFKRISNSLGAPWNNFEGDLKIVCSSIEDRKPDKNPKEVKDEIIRILDSVSDPSISDELISKIDRALQKGSSWSRVKDAGLSFVPQGDPSMSCRRLLENLKTYGFFIVPVGQLERFCPSVGGHGPSWVIEVLKKDLRNDLELRSAREFCSEIKNWSPKK
ncbi:MAG: ATP-binding protein [Candidatus Riflebacteria bacterium]|nr:ATP-binding protein [Candidatus Riflebacteria bacterium]